MVYLFFCKNHNHSFETMVSVSKYALLCLHYLEITIILIPTCLSETLSVT